MPEKRPNILFIVSDQMVADLTSAYGHPVVQTPHLQGLAESGVRFDSAYTPFPLCAPGRACIMSGRQASEIGAWDNGAPLTCDQPTFATYLAAAGYDTVLSGKMHFVGPDQLHGFRRRLTTDIYSSDFGWVRDEWIALKESKGANPDEVMANRRSYNATNYVAEGVEVDTWHTALSYDEEAHFRAIEYLRAQGESDGEQPFLLVASYHHPHEPFHAPQHYWDLYEGADIELAEYPTGFEADRSQMDLNLNAYHGISRYDVRDPVGQARVRRGYYGVTSYLDDKVGGLLRTLEETGLADNTIVVFASDHGDMLCEREMVQKRCFYEWSCRVPLIVKFPDGWKSGSTVETPVSLLDLLPTFNDLAGYTDALPHDGTSLLPLLENGEDCERLVFSQAHEAVGMPCIMARQGTLKYNYMHRYPAQLFDLATDPGEWNNLVGDPAHEAAASHFEDLVLERFDPEEMADENLDSLYRRELIGGVMRDHGHTWSHEPGLDHRKGAMQQYLA
ncbi:MAG: choline-sulfatase [Gemmatimonadetes bacterium]|jgi:choline-sulfatase|nr:choline-sulfatase [Gemmatimonadota bacterium]MBT6146624.1 choline-sulfatase [Gemmatimonadota bacterium]